MENTVVLKLMFFFSQEGKWTGKMQKIKEEHDSEKSLVGLTGCFNTEIAHVSTYPLYVFPQLQEELFKLLSAVSEGREESRRQVQELSHRLQEQQQIIASQNKQVSTVSHSQHRKRLDCSGFPVLAQRPTA